MSLTAKPLGVNNPLISGHAADIYSSGAVVGHTSDNDPMKMLSMRMRWHNMIRAPFEHISVYYNPGHPTAYVFIIHKGEPVTLTDDTTMFPSDQLITQLRLLLG